MVVYQKVLFLKEIIYFKLLEGYVVFDIDCGMGFYVFVNVWCIFR